MNLKRLGQVLILAAIALVTFTAWGVQRYVNTVAAKFGTTVRVVVASQAIPARTVITDKMLDYRQIPLQAMLPGMYKQQSEQDLVGQTILVGVRQGDVVTRSMIGGGGVADPNVRSYAVVMTDRVIFPPDVASGERVDVLASYKDKDGKPQSKVILSGLSIMEVKKEDRLQTMVLAVSPSDAETLAWYENFGQQVRFLRHG